MLIEMLVAVFLVSLLMLSVVSSYLFVEKFLNLWKTTNAIYQEGEYITSLITRDLGECYKFSKPDSATYYILLVSGDTVVYKTDSLTILRNKRRLNKLKSKKKAFRISTPAQVAQRFTNGWASNKNIPAAAPIKPAPLRVNK